MSYWSQHSESEQFNSDEVTASDGHSGLVKKVFGVAMDTAVISKTTVQ